MLPPLLLCFFRVLERSEIHEYRLPKRLLNSALLASGSVVISLIWGLALSRADQGFAEIYPQAAADVGGIADKIRSYSSGEWGFRYYLGRKGAGALPADTSLVRGGQFVVVPKLAQPNEIPADLRSILISVQTLSYRPETPLRVLDRQTHAGFWSTGWGLIPFSFSRQILEQVEVFQINFMAKQLPWAYIETASGINPWPGYVTLDGQSPLAILAKPGTSIRYPWTVDHPARLELQCGVSPESYKNGSDRAFEFAIGQLGRDGNVLAENRITLRPGIGEGDQSWQPVRMDLVPERESVLYFRYNSDNGANRGVGAFAQSLVRPGY